MFETNGMRVFFLTRHVSLRQMPDMITKERIKDYVKRCLEALEKLGVTGGTMAIAGLNPHCGEHGLFGDEEVREIMPAIEELQAEGYPVTGPIGADSVFHQAAQGRFNSVLSSITIRAILRQRHWILTGRLPSQTECRSSELPSTMELHLTSQVQAK